MMLGLSVLAAVAIWWWSVAGGPVATLRGHAGQVYVIAISPDGKFLASGGADGVVRLWDIEGGSLRRELADGAGTFVGWVAFSPDGGMLVAGGTRRDDPVRLWETASGKLKETLPSSGRPDWLRRDPALDAGGKYRVEGDDRYQPKALTIFDAATGSKVAAIEGHPDQINAWAFDPSGEMLATGGGWTSHPWPVNPVGDARIWDLRTGRMLARLGGHWGAVSDVAFTPDGAILVTACYDGRIRLWDVGRHVDR